MGMGECLRKWRYSEGVPQLKLFLLQDRLAICRLMAGETIPAWASSGGGFCSVTRTAGELSIVCAENAVPPGVPCERAWRIFEIEGPFDFAATGVLVSAARPLAEAGVTIFAISTFDTDYVLVKQEHAGNAVRALESAGHRVTRCGSAEVHDGNAGRPPIRASSSCDNIRR